MRRMLFSLSLLALVLAPLSVSAKSVASLTPGSLVKSQDSSAVYYFGRDEMRYVFPDEGTYFGWYADFSTVTTIGAEDMAKIPVGGIVYHRPFQKWLKVTSDPKVYYVGPAGELSPIADEATANALWGSSNWGTNVLDVDPTTLGRYVVSGEITADVAPFLILAQTLFEAFLPEPINISLAQDLSEPVVAYITDVNQVDFSINLDAGSIVARGQTVKFVNQSSAALTVREENNLFTSGTIEGYGVGVIRLNVPAGEYTIGLDEVPGVAATITVTE